MAKVKQLLLQRHHHWQRNYSIITWKRIHLQLAPANTKRSNNGRRKRGRRRKWRRNNITHFRINTTSNQPGSWCYQRYTWSDLKQKFTVDVDRDRWNTHQRISDTRLHGKSISSSLSTWTWRSSVTTRKRHHARGVLQASNMVQRWKICTVHLVEILRIKFYNEVEGVARRKDIC